MEWLFLVSILSSYIGVERAKGYNRSPVAWGIVCFLLWPAVIVLFLIGEKKERNSVAEFNKHYDAKARS